MRDVIIVVRTVRIGCIGLALVAMTACIRANPPASAHSLRGHGAVIEVRNDNFDDCVIYLIRSGTPIPLGITLGLSRSMFRVREGQLGDGGAVVLGSGKRGGPIERITTAFDLPPGHLVSWIVRYGDRTEQPVVR